MRPQSGSEARMNTAPQTTSRPKILIFDEEACLVEALAYMLLKNGYQPLIASSRVECLDTLRTARPELILRDLFRPVEEGLEFCREICRTRKVPLIMLTTQASEEDCIQGLELCADDYVVKPFSMAVLLARIHSVLRRSKPSESPLPTSIKQGDFTYSAERRELLVRGEPVVLHAKQFKLLHYLMTPPDVVLSREALIQGVWGDTVGREVTLTSVDVYIRQIRERIEPDPAQPTHIVTVRGRGYLFIFGDEGSQSQ